MRRRKESGGEADDNTPKQRVVLLHLRPRRGRSRAARRRLRTGTRQGQRGPTPSKFLTTHHDRSHCFPETTDGTLGVATVCDWMPRSVLGHLYAVCSYLRMIFARRVPSSGSAVLRPDVVVCDQVSACVPVLKWGVARVVFYCHFPDLMLAERSGLLRRIYRWPIDTLEQWSTGKADTVLVNSKFTGDVFRRVFPKLADVPLHVLHPTTSLSRLDRPLEGSLEDLGIHPSGAVFLSLNRYERKKNLGLALRALELAIREVPCHLVVAGGYDVNHRENVEHYEELQNLAKELSIAEHVSFLKSPAEPAKQQLLHSCRGVIYTPANEHFGIVPLEAMYMRRPVVACDSGGPTETVADGETGFLCAPTAESFASAMVRLGEGPESLAGDGGRAGGRERWHSSPGTALSASSTGVVFESKEAPRVKESAAGVGRSTTRALT
uniref:Alpha-1,3/1,6-mannosyltransferase ALG2 n=2 Tax=Ixodes ricinus TaxID=34613 RepID=V5I394_IXORI